MQVVLNILIIIIILGVLISIHELGHLLVAKLFHVYCFEYSIGFGPKIFRKKRKNGETAFALRAFPLGGYVSMYGEPGAVPEGEIEPPADRSLNAIHKGKKCLILVAGVTMNFILGLVLIFISDIAFPNYYIGYGGSVTTSSKAQMELDTVPLTYGGEIKSYIETQKEAAATPQDYYLSIKGVTADNTYFRVVDSNVKIFSADGTPYGGDASYVAIYYPTTLVSEHDVATSFAFYPVKASAEPTADMIEMGITALPDFSIGAFSFSDKGSYAVMNLDLVAPALSSSKSSSDLTDAFANHKLVTPVTLRYDGTSLNSQSATVQVVEEWLGWNGAWKKWASDVPTACGAIVKGFASLFSPGGFNNLSGIVGMTSALPQIESLGGAGYVFYFAGLLSINLAFFNLLPFPGLDGWQLVVTAIEGVSRKKVPAKAQAIMQIIGFVLLFGLMIAVTVKDVIALF